MKTTVKNLVIILLITGLILVGFSMFGYPVCSFAANKSSESLMVKDFREDIENNKLSWRKVKNATGYKLYLNGKKIKTIRNNNETSFSYKFESGSTYEFKIKAYKKKSGKKNKIQYGKSSCLSITTMDIRGGITFEPEYIAKPQCVIIEKGYYCDDEWIDEEDELDGKWLEDSGQYPE